MSILDDAIREHLELKRAHGADEAEVKRLEDEAFGPPGRPEEPDPSAEAPTEFMATPGAAEAEGDEDSGSRRINIADLQEPPPPDAGPIAPAEDAAQAAPPAEEEPLAAEHEVVDEAPAEPEPIAAEETLAHSTEERHAIAEQATEIFDVESELVTEDSPATAAVSPSDEELAAAEASEPKLTPIEPATEIHASRAEAPAADLAEEDEEDDAFWNEQRLSDELDQALEAPIVEGEPLEAPILEEEEVPEEDEIEEEAPAQQLPIEPAPEPKQQADYDPDTGHEDVLEDTPDFLEDAPEDDELWFEQRPPKDFDFDD